MKGLRNMGFTLIEIMVASIIGAFIAVIAVTTLRSVSICSEKVSEHIDKAAEIRFASKMISTDLMNLYREKDFENMVFVGTLENDSQQGAVNLRFYT
ncbi:MAG TPA: prepilin-type N-terminal cleavage/methylation domain-containing protein, partial [Sedimentisphaerales bacterium]|nr:prepilin-type N-terminal cleavage/methylation domain-containing protein [Sedimentisphaerales bacterium]